ncbi:MerR family transcriptional regulator [Corynebacterium senegalense]|uniref:transcriptional regulator FtsR n=1 Tax=Corynebacterium senegalense TaxID=2080750 RepID=UPI000E20089D|nr:MerR family transcriptional regulator [Corynebacterium senegalense]
MSIGVVLNRLREEFPDVTVSKIRFLESEGLITPQRTASGYRRFTDEDVERLRYILVTQRDNYLPLKVIREQLDAMDSGQVTALMSASNAEPIVSPETFRAPAATRLSDVDLAAQANTELSTVDQLVGAGLLSPDASGHFGADDVRVVTTALALTEFGLDIRHLKSLRTTAGRQADLISQVTEPVAKSRTASAKQKAEEIGHQMTALVVSLHADLVKNELRSRLDA